MDCFDYNNSGSHEIIGCFETNLAHIQQASATYAVRCVEQSLNQPVSPFISKFAEGPSHILGVSNQYMWGFLHLHWSLFLWCIWAARCWSLKPAFGFSSGWVWLHQQKEEREEERIQKLWRYHCEEMLGRLFFLDSPLSVNVSLVSTKKTRCDFYFFRS